MNYALTLLRCGNKLPIGSLGNKMINFPYFDEESNGREVWLDMDGDTSAAMLTADDLSKLSGKSAFVLRKLRESGDGPPWIPFGRNQVRYFKRQAFIWMESFEGELYFQDNDGNIIPVLSGNFPSGPSSEALSVCQGDIQRSRRARR